MTDAECAAVLREYVEGRSDPLGAAFLAAVVRAIELLTKSAEETAEHQREREAR